MGLHQGRCDYCDKFVDYETEDKSQNCTCAKELHEIPHDWKKQNVTLAARVVDLTAQRDRKSRGLDALKTKFLLLKNAFVDKGQENLDLTAQRDRFAEGLRGVCYNTNDKGSRFCTCCGQWVDQDGHAPDCAKDEAERMETK